MTSGYDALSRLLEACERATDHLHATYSDSLADGCDPNDIHKACPVALELDRAIGAVQKAVGEGAVMLPATLVEELCFYLAVGSDLAGLKLFRALYEVKRAANTGVTLSDNAAPAARRGDGGG